MYRRNGNTAAKTQETQATRTLTGAQILMEVLKEEGVDTIFGFPGGVVIDIFDEMAQSDIQHILVRHEQGAVHAADGYARVNKKVGVCLVTSGPGATNTVTGIASAYMDSIPVVVITGHGKILVFLERHFPRFVSFLIHALGIQKRRHREV